MQALADKGVKVKAFDGIPELDESMVFYWNAFVVLSQSRPIGLGVGAIPLSDMKAFCDLMEITGVEERMTFIRLMQAMDSIVVEQAQQKERR